MSSGVVMAKDMLLDFETVKMKKIEAVMESLKAHVAQGKLYVDISEMDDLYYDIYASIFKEAGYFIQSISSSRGRFLLSPLTIVRVSIIALPE